MADTLFKDFTSPNVVASWLNDINKLAYQGLSPTYGATSGSANAQVLTLPASSLLTSLSSNRFECLTAFGNTGPTTFAIQITGGPLLGPYPLLLNGAALAGGELVAGGLVTIMFDGANFELLSPPAVVANATNAVNATNAANLNNTASQKLPSLTVTQASSALTFSMASMYLDFRNATLTSGTPSTINAAPANLVLPSGGTLGFTSGVQGRMVLAVMNNAGTAELAVASIAGGLAMNEEGVISTTAIGAGSTAANVWYSTTARANLSYRIIGAIDAVNTAGAWGNPVAVINAGGAALSSINSAILYSPAVTPVPSTVGVFAPSYTHNLGSVPSDAWLEYVCLTTEQNYSVGDVVKPTSQWNGTTAIPIGNIVKNTTVITGGFSVSTYVVNLHNKTTGSAFTPTGANWAYRFAYRR
jgi:hypothetical protein